MCRAAARASNSPRKNHLFVRISKTLFMSDDELMILSQQSPCVCRYSLYARILYRTTCSCSGAVRCATVKERKDSSAGLDLFSPRVDAGRVTFTTHMTHAGSIGSFFVACLIACAEEYNPFHTIRPRDRNRFASDVLCMTASRRRRRRRPGAVQYRAARSMHAASRRWIMGWGDWTWPDLTDPAAV
jgi:hypothetical protein